mmetsp:Transcript_66052/g.184659  ORF Transcript_66052/g.184659 Transcript_66052/m.184659 type:complete len:131 (+) Transcript_66052:433-825(+)
MNLFALCTLARRGSHRCRSSLVEALALGSRPPFGFSSSSSSSQLFRNKRVRRVFVWSAGVSFDSRLTTGKRLFAHDIHGNFHHGIGNIMMCRHHLYFSNTAADHHMMGIMIMERVSVMQAFYVMLLYVVL